MGTGTVLFTSLGMALESGLSKQLTDDRDETAAKLHQQLIKPSQVPRRVQPGGHIP